MAAVFADAGFGTIGVDVDPEAVEAINDGRPPVDEPRLADKIESAGDGLSATKDYTEAVHETDASFIIVPTPSKDDGSFSLDYVLEAGKSIGEALASKDEYHLVVLTSTVLPGSTEFGLQEVLEEASGKTCGEDFGLCYSPEFIALGSVVPDMLEPDMVLIGESDEQAGALLASVYDEVCQNDPPIERMNFVNAELAKLALNTFVTTKITFANLLAETCEELPGADVDDVTTALGKDTRIGPTYITGSVGYGGPCFPRDNVALSRLLDGIGVSSDLPRTIDSTNARQAKRVADKAVESADAGPGARIGVLGLSYKPNTPVTTESQGLKIALHLLQHDTAVTVYDPIALDSAQDTLGDRVCYADSLEDCLRDVDAVVIATAWEEFEGIDEKLQAMEDPPTVVDGWRMLRGDIDEDADHYQGVGLGPREEDLVANLQSLVDRIVGRQRQESVQLDVSRRS